MRKIFNKGRVLMTRNNKIKIDISRTILAFVLIFSIYTLFNAEQIAAQLLAIGGFIGILFLFILSFTPWAKSKNK